MSEESQEFDKQLKAEQEDYVLEEGLERWRERKALQKELKYKNWKEDNKQRLAMEFVANEKEQFEEYCQVAWECEEE